MNRMNRIIHCQHQWMIRPSTVVLRRPPVSSLLPPKSRYPFTTSSQQTSNTKPRKAWPYILLFTTSTALITYGIYEYYLSPISIYPSSVRSHLRKALYAHRYQQEFRDAERYYLLAINELTQSNSANDKDVGMEIIGIEGLLGEVYEELKQLPNAIQWYENAMVHLLNLKDMDESTKTVKVIQLCNKIGTLYSISNPSSSLSTNYFELGIQLLMKFDITFPKRFTTDALHNWISTRPAPTSSSPPSTTTTITNSKQDPHNLYTHLIPRPELHAYLDAMASHYLRSNNTQYAIPLYIHLFTLLSHPLDDIDQEPEECRYRRAVVANALGNAYTELWYQNQRVGVAGNHKDVNENDKIPNQLLLKEAHTWTSRSIQLCHEPTQSVSESENNWLTSLRQTISQLVTNKKYHTHHQSDFIAITIMGFQNLGKIYELSSQNNTAKRCYSKALEIMAQHANDSSIDWDRDIWRELRMVVKECREGLGRVQ